MRFGERGASDWTVGKLLSVVVVVVVLVLLIFGVKNGMVPNIEKIEQKFNDVINLLKFWDGEGDVECYEDAVVSFVGGDAFLESVGFAGKNVRVGWCDGVCNISGGGLVPHRIKDGSFQRFMNGEWEEERNFFVGESEQYPGEGGLNSSHEALRNRSLRGKQVFWIEHKLLQ